MTPSPPTDGAPHAAPGVRAPAVSLPRGGGAIRGIGETFGTDPATGTGAMTVPIATPPGRGGFGPSLALAYDSGAGNSPFGLGWTLALPQVARRTDRGVPRYADAEDSDTFVLAGAEDLVPLLVEEGGAWRPAPTARRTVGGAEWDVRRWRPRTEGLFARVERWTRRADAADVCWRTIAPDGVTTWYGTSAATRVADPDDPARILTWLAAASHDVHGNAIAWEYAAEDSRGVDLALAHERHRTDAARAAARHPKRVRWGNRTPYLDALAIDPAAPLPADWMFEVVFDYGEHDADRPTPEPAAPWPCRPDPYSSYRGGFELRSYRLCRRVLVFHHFPELGDAPCLVRATELTHAVDAGADAAGTALSCLRAVTQAGFRRRADGSYLRRALPPVEFEYSRAVVQDAVREVDAASLEGLPAGVDGVRHRWLDLDGEGVAGVLSETAGAWTFAPNLSPVAVGDDGAPAARLGASAPVPTIPAPARPDEAGTRFLDLAGDGRPDLVRLERAAPGFHERDPGVGWGSYTPFRSAPTVDWDDPDLRLVDLTGDGLADVLVPADDALVWYPSLGEAGFDAPRRVALAADEALAPRLLLADAGSAVLLADMSGDGLADLVRVRNGEVAWWPNLGHGRFGARVTMDRAPRLDLPDRFDPRRVRLADVDGSGVADLLYFGADGVDLWFNQSGGAWGARRRLAGFPRVDDPATVQVVDLLGNGTACLVWSSPLPGDAARPMRYVDLMGGTKPHLLVRAANGLGAETRVTYAPSTRFQLADRLAGRPWLARLPFPVHVVERVETLDHPSGNRFVSRHAYHHGHWDPVEREFRGFGMVERWDTETIPALGPAPAGEPGAATNEDAASHVPPVHTKTWFHTGAWLDRDHVSDFHAGLRDDGDAGEYWREPGLDDAAARALLLPDTVLPAGLADDEAREACRALRGALLRQETYALDGSARAPHPYVVTERTLAVRLVQPRAGNRHAVLHAHPREAVTFHYERDPADPRVRHELTLAVDDWGHVLRAAAVAYGRRRPDPALSPEDQAVQARLLATASEAAYTSAIDADDAWRAPLACERREWELTGLAPEAGAPRLSFDAVRAALDAAAPIPPEAEPTPGRLEKRLLAHARTRWRPDDLGTAAGDADALLPLGTLQPRAIAGESWTLALTPGLLAGALGGRADDATLADEGRYVRLEGSDGWWAPSGRTYLSPGADDAPAVELAEARAHFFLPRRVRDPFHRPGFATESVVRYDAHDLLVRETRDALGNRVTAGERDADGALAGDGNDYRALHPVLVTDANGNRAAVAVDALGLVVGTAVMGKPGEALGDTLDGFDPDPDDAAVLAHLADPTADPHALLQGATARVLYDPHAWARTRHLARPSPTVVCTLTRETHAAALPPGERPRVRQTFAYADGLGRELQRKLPAEPGPVPERDPATGAIVLDGGRPRMTADAVAPRWVGSGWTVRDNKGNVVRAFEPFFTDTHAYEGDVRVGVSPIVCWDPVGRAVATVRPDRTWEKVVVGAWGEARWDGCDTALVADPTADVDVGPLLARLPTDAVLPTWHAARIDGALGESERAAAVATARHAATPAVVHADPLGRAFLTVTHNRWVPAGAPADAPPVEERAATRVVLDVQGRRRAVIDARGVAVLRETHDLAGAVLYADSPDAGARWALADVAGRPLRTWDARGHARHVAHDVLGRPTRTWVRGSDAAQSDPRTLGAELLVHETEYGEAHPDAEALNLRGRAWRVRDGAGLATHVGVDPLTGRAEGYDFKGNPLRATRRLASDHRALPDWSGDVALDAETFATATAYDALDRPVRLTAPDGSEVAPTWDEAGLLERVEARLRGDAAWTTVVAGIDHDARGQRLAIALGDGVRTTYAHDPLTFRLVRLASTRAAEGDLQELSYTYDAVGNPVGIRDAARDALWFANAEVTADAAYDYDALYRLVRATGREHVGQSGQPDDRDVPLQPLPHTGDGAAMRRWTETYAYDAVGNLMEMAHRAEGATAALGSWTRRYAYAVDSNRLLATSVPGDDPAGPWSATYAHDAHGSMTRMPHLPTMAWDHADRLRATARQVMADGTPETTHHVYDAAGERVRTVTDAEAAPGVAPRRRRERIRIGGFEVYREYAADGSTVTLARETLHVMDGARRVALVETRTIGDDGSPARLVRFPLADHLGSARVEVDDAGRVVSYEEYHPWGTTAYRAHDAALGAPARRHRYTGQERDEESGLARHGARYYAPWLGRWTAADPAGLEAGVNRFAFCHDAPVRYVDPDGRNPVLFWLFVVTAPWFLANDQSTADPRMDSHIREGLRGVAATADRAGLPSGFMREVLDDPGVYFSRAGQITPTTMGRGGNLYLPVWNEMPLDIERVEHPRYNTSLFYHELTHAFIDRRLDRGDPRLEGLVERGTAYYTDAPLEWGGTSRDPERLLHEAAAMYVADRIAARENAMAVLTDFLADPPAPDDDVRAFVEGIRTSYDHAMQDDVVGYEVVGGDQVETTKPIFPELQAYLDEVVLEGRITSRFDDDPVLTHLHTQLREQLRARPATSAP